MAVARFHTTSRRLSRRRAIRTWLLSTIADTHPTYLIWRILMDSVHFCPYIITKVCSPWFHLFSPLFGRVEELVELFVKRLVEVSGYAFNVQLLHQLPLFWPAKDDAAPTSQRLNKPRKRYNWCFEAVGVEGSMSVFAKMGTSDSNHLQKMNSLDVIATLQQID